jgi:carboxylate-amine ligase
LIGDLVARVGPALKASGDSELVAAGLAEIQSRGTGSTLQRNAYAERQKLSDVIDAVVAATTNGTARADRR